MSQSGSDSGTSSSSDSVSGFAGNAMKLFNTVQGLSIREVIRGGFSMTIFAIFGSIATGIVEVSQLFTQPVDALGSALVEVVNAFLVRPLAILIQGATTSVVSISPGGAFDLGPFTWWLALLIFIGGAYGVSRYLEEEDSSNVIPGAPFDIPLPPFRDEDADDD